MRHFKALAMVFSTLALAGCAYGDDGQAFEAGAEEEVAESEDELLWGALVQEVPSTLTFYENQDFTGASYTVQVDATTNENVRLIPKTEIESAGMLSRVSAVRLACGTRAANVTLFDAWNTGTSLGSWSPYSKAAMLSCAANQVQQKNLHYDAPELADRVASVYFVGHASKSSTALFSSVVISNWNAALQELPSGATASGGPILQLRGSSLFSLRQNLKLDDWKCGKRSAYFILNASMNQADRTFSVTVASSYVDSGWGDSWGCRDKMKSALDSAAVDAAADLDAGLESLAQIVGTHPRYYLFPLASLADFDIAGGGTSSTSTLEPIVTDVYMP